MKCSLHCCIINVIRSCRCEDWRSAGVCFKCLKTGQAFVTLVSWLVGIFWVSLPSVPNVCNYLCYVYYCCCCYCCCWCCGCCCFRLFFACLIFNLNPKTNTEHVRIICYILQKIFGVIRYTLQLNLWFCLCFSVCIRSWVLM